MRAVIQRVSRASVIVQNAVKGRIEKGLLVLLAVEEADGSKDIAWLSGKIVRLRVFPDDNGVMNRSVLETGDDILVISQFLDNGPIRPGLGCRQTAGPFHQREIIHAGHVRVTI